jgi:thiol-disulfide isomerase/thioredoxin
MIKKKKALIVLLTFFLFILGCVETPLEIPEFQVGESERVVLVEYLTGVKCPNCPRATTILKGVKDNFSENIAVVAIHGRFLTEPLSISKYDFRNDFSRQLEESYRPFIGKPAAMINRVKFEDEPNLAADLPDLWPSYIVEQISKESNLNIVSAHKFDVNTRQLEINLGILARELINEGLKLSVYLTESNIIDAQETVGSVIVEYEHDHILRHMLTAWDGDVVAQNMKNGEIVNRTFSYTIPQEFISENCEIVVAVSALNNRRVFQAHKFNIL